MSDIQRIQIPTINTQPIKNDNAYQLLKQAVEQVLSSEDATTIRAVAINDDSYLQAQMPLNDTTNTCINMNHHATIIQISVLVNAQDTESILVDAALEELIKDTRKKNLEFKREYRDKAKRIYEKAEKELKQAQENT